ncbi:MAG TPA: hypothetical protein ENI19_01000 [Candidatus Nealsonbacteria bacterium]|uniref:Glycerophosphoryl diester phosphodiesterase membrane domain-containing protein n=1 Tax=marine sediment metagenome TaxID=412755 RepID=A0A0F9UF40_9ZZZZ|nr:hypothetical protein [Candidatus Nealsonbacteria bacterium]HEB46270.1 hypothetical protein [Candidatus Nealsonbacteria bacterium]
MKNKSIENQQFSSLPPQPEISSLPGIGDLFSRTWQIYKERIWVFLGIMILPVFINLGIALFSGGLFISVSEPERLSPLLTIWLPVMPIFVLTAIIINLWAPVALLYATKEREEKIRIKESFVRGWHKIISYSWISFLMGIIIFFGFLLFIIPGIIFIIWFSLATYVLVAEDLTGTKALSRSKQLVSGNWWKVFWRFSVITIIAIVISLIINFISRLAGIPREIDIFSVIILLFFVPFAVTYTFLIYEDLRKLKESVPI